VTESREQVPPVSQDSDTTNVTWRNSLFGPGTAICFAVGAIFIRSGLEGLPSPLLGVTVGMINTTVVYYDSTRIAIQAMCIGIPLVSTLKSKHDGGTRRLRVPPHAVHSAAPPGEYEQQDR
jgi:hypothetical protein